MNYQFLQRERTNARDAEILVVFYVINNNLLTILHLGAQDTA